MDFKNKKITVMGLGLHGGGVGVVNFLIGQGAQVTVTDLRKEEELKESLNQLKKKKIKYVLGKHREEDFINTDLVIKNPGVPQDSKYLAIAQKNKVPVETETGLFFEFCPAPIIGITGSKGKSTTATLIFQILQKKYSKVFLTGNIGGSALEKLDKIDKKSLVVFELSSWQLNGLHKHQKSPHYAIVTNILRDHLNYYQDLGQYIEDKKEIFKWQKTKDYLILNYDDQVVRNFYQEAKAKIFFFSRKKDSLQNSQIKLWIKGKEILFGKDSEKVCSLDKISLEGDHNLSNVLAAVLLAKLLNISNNLIKKTLIEFKGIQGRLQLIRTINQVKYINDTTATIPEATIAALKSFPKDQKIILIAGGADKKLKFQKLAALIQQRVKILILLKGNATDKIKKAIGDRVKIIGPFVDMEKAVKIAQQKSQANDVVMLSPAAASFGLFRHEFERGEKFNKAVKKLKNESA